MNQNTPNKGLALRWPHPWSLLIEWGSRGSPRTTLNHGGTGHQLWLPVRDGDERSCHPSNGIMINSRGERRTKALERTKDLQQTPSKTGRRNQRVQTQSPHSFSGIFACGSGGSPSYWGWPLIKINSFHNNIWFDYLILFYIYLRLMILMQWNK